jgi:hypothetical protein
VVPGCNMEQTLNNTLAGSCVWGSTGPHHCHAPCGTYSGCHLSHFYELFGTYNPRADDVTCAVLCCAVLCCAGTRGP